MVTDGLRCTQPFCMPVVELGVAGVWASLAYGTNRDRTMCESGGDNKLIAARFWGIEHPFKSCGVLSLAILP